MGLLAPFYHLWDTISYIHEYGWEEYKEARKRYDNHARLQGYGDAKYNHRNAIKQINLAKKRK